MSDTGKQPDDIRDILRGFTELFAREETMRTVLLKPNRISPISQEYVAKKVVITGPIDGTPSRQFIYTATLTVTDLD